MKILQLTQKNLDTVGITRNLSRQPYPFNAKIIIAFLLMGLYLICSLVYFFFEAETFVEYIQSAYLSSCVALIFFILAIVIFNVGNLFEIIDDCENLVNTQLKYSASKSIFNKYFQMERKFSGMIIFMLVQMTPVCIFVTWMIYMFFIYLTTDSGNAGFELPFPIWFPFNWKNPFGFLIALALQYVVISYGLKIAACGLSFWIGINLYACASCNCIKQNLFAIGQSCRYEIERKLIQKQFIEFIDSFSTVKRLVNDFSNLFQKITAIIFVWSLVTICGALLIVQVQIMQHSDNLVILMITVFQAFYAFGGIFFVTELCQRVNLRFDECNDIIDQFEWYLFPVEIQRMLPIAINFAQQPVEIKCFGSWACNRELFKYVTKTAFSYFMVLRKFYD